MRDSEKVEGRISRVHNATFAQEAIKNLCYQLPPEFDFQGGLPELEMAFILRILKEAGGDTGRAAARLGICRKTLYNKLEKIGWKRCPPKEKNKKNAEEASCELEMP